MQMQKILLTVTDELSQELENKRLKLHLKNKQEVIRQILTQAIIDS